MEFIKALLEQQPLMALFLTIAIGYLVGEINIKGFSLGVGAVLFVALAMGWFAPKSVPAPMVGTLGLALFLYAVGVQYGKQFFIGLTSAAGAEGEPDRADRRAAAGAVSLLFVKTMDLEPRLCAWACSRDRGPARRRCRRPSRRSATTIRRSATRSSYPFGVAGPILFLYIAFMFLKPKIEAPSAAGMEMLEIAAAQPGAVRQDAGRADERAARRRADRGAAPRRTATSRHRPDIVIAENDVAARRRVPPRTALEQAQQGPRRGGARARRSRIAATSTTCACSPPARPWSAGPLGDLDLPGDKAAVVVQVRRGDADILPRPDLVLEFGDRVGLLAHRGDFPAMRKFFGDSIKGTAEFSYISIGIGMALGFLLGAIQFPLPGIGKIALGLSGVLIVALILGNLRRTARHELDHPALGQPRAAQPRADAVPRAGRDGLRARSSPRRSRTPAS